MSNAEQEILAVLVGLDETAALVLTKVPNVTISTCCGVILLGGKVPGIDFALGKLLGAALNDVQRAHCYQALLDDARDCADTLAWLTPFCDPARAHGAVDQAASV